MLTLEDDAAYSDELEEAWEIFAEDGKEDLDLAEEALLALETNPSDTDQIARLFRGLHKFKGNARMMGLPVLESLFHHAEDLAALVRDEGVPITCEMIELLLEVLDRSRAMLNYTLTHRRDVEENQVEDLVQRLSEALERYAHPPSEPAVAAPVTDLRDNPPHVHNFPEEVMECATTVKEAQPARPVGAEMVEATLARLGQVVELLSSEVTSSPYRPSLATLRRPARKVADLLSSLYPVCVFHKLESAAHLSLALASLYSHVARGRLVMPIPLLAITHTYARTLSSALKRLDDGKVADSSLFSGLLVQVEGMHVAHLLSGPASEPPLELGDDKPRTST